MEKPLLLARVPSEAVVVSAYSSASLWTEILKGLFMLHTVCTVLYCTVLYRTIPAPGLPRRPRDRRGGRRAQTAQFRAAVPAPH